MSLIINWQSVGNIGPRSYRCGYCGHFVGPDRGYYAENPTFRIYICSFCNQPSYFAGDHQTPGIAYGNEVDHLPDGVGALYREARNCVAVSSFTAAVLTCRKLLMNVAVAQSAPEGQSYLAYVTYLAEKGYVPPHGRGWVDHIREKGNEANHEIKLIERADAEQLISFVEMLLKFIYEFPKKIPVPKITPGPQP